MEEDILKLLKQVQYIKDNLDTRQAWTKCDYEDFYLRDMQVLFKLSELVKTQHEKTSKQLVQEKVT